jgi:hypothetical protein
MQRAIRVLFLTFILFGSSHAFVISDIPIKIINETNETGINIIPELTKLPPLETPDLTTAPVDPVAPVIIDDLLDPSLLNVTISCNASQISTPVYDLFFGHDVDVDKPDYLLNATRDCHLYGKDEEITEDLDEKLAILDAIEAELEDVEDDADDLLGEGEDALDCIREAEHGFESASASGYLREAYTDIGSSHPGATTYDVVLRSLKNFHAEFEDAHTAKNYTNAALESLESIVDGLENYCLQRKCMYPERKEYYEDLLEAEHNKALHYARETEGFIDNARMYAQNYHDLKGNYITWENCIVPVSEQYDDPRWQDLNYSNLTDGDNSVKLNVSIQMNETPGIPLSVDKFERVLTVKFVPGNDEEEPKYVVTRMETRKLLWVLDVDVEISTHVSADDGLIINEELPFWSFLLTG